MNPSSPLPGLAQGFSSYFAQVLGSMTGQEYASAAIPSASPPSGCEWLAYGVTGAVSGMVSVGAASAAAVRLGNEVLTAAGVEADESSARSTFSELVSQALSAWSQKLAEDLGGPLVVEAGRSLASPAGGQSFLVSVLSSGEAIAEFCLCPSEEFGAGFARLTAKAEPAAELLPAAATGGTPPALDLLMDVELPVSVSFGRAQLAIREVLKLSSGSIVELARNVSEPVELIVNNCVIARGEVVVIEGNYGVRIEQIVSPQERLRTLK